MELPLQPRRRQDAERDCAAVVKAQLANDWDGVAALLENIDTYAVVNVLVAWFLGQVQAAQEQCRVHNNGEAPCFEEYGVPADMQAWAEWWQAKILAQ
jgi:hypothetical protein